MNVAHDAGLNDTDPIIRAADGIGIGKKVRSHTEEINMAEFGCHTFTVNTE
ncbi:MAG TPA: hypothetical protein VG122_25900 [Gemmata sp.]|nr:hypothetical protein [Gemmata sp.]